MAFLERFQASCPLYYYSMTSCICCFFPVNCEPKFPRYFRDPMKSRINDPNQDLRNILVNQDLDSRDPVNQDVREEDPSLDRIFVVAWYSGSCL